MSVQEEEIYSDIGIITTDEARHEVAAGTTVILLPLGSIEPHGPHLPLGTDCMISETTCDRAVMRLEEEGIRTFVAPTIPYGVTDFAAGFAGAISIPPAALTAYLRAVVEAMLAQGFTHVCVVNNHLEPAHDEAARAAVAGLTRASYACPLERRFARTLSDEFKKGECHAGRYETSLVLAAEQETRDFSKLPHVAVSLSEAIRAGKKTFAEMGMTHAYTGSPSEASRDEGDELYELLVDMVVTVVKEGLTRAIGPS